jgi:hypothetical protein
VPISWMKVEMRVSRYPSSPPRLGDRLLLLSAKGRRFTGVASRVVVLGAFVWSPSICWFMDSADRGPEAAQRLVWRCPVDLGSQSAGDDAAVPRMAAQ